jgi:hypothetical protein
MRTSAPCKRSRCSAQLLIGNGTLAKSEAPHHVEAALVTGELAIPGRRLNILVAHEFLKGLDVPVLADELGGERSAKAVGMGAQHVVSALVADTHTQVAQVRADESPRGRGRRFAPCASQCSTNSLKLEL